MYTELHADNSLSLIINSVEEKHAGKYTCKGTYTRNIQLVKTMTLDTMSEYKIAIKIPVL